VVRRLASLLVPAALLGCGGAEATVSGSAAVEAVEAGGTRSAAETTAAETTTAADGRAPATAAAPTGRYTTARVIRRTWLRAAPGGRRIAKATRTTSFGSPHVLSVVRRQGNWLAVHAPEQPNGRAAWLPTTAVVLGAVDLAIHVDRSKRLLTVRRGKRLLRRVTVAVGRPGHETPTGRFAVTDKLLMPPGTPYGCCAVALTGHQTSLPAGWGGGDRLAVHGTSEPASVGQPVSLGCLRAAQADIRWLMRRIPLGAPVFVKA
jgi:lipoprotein-anchoring transpeptidase ErfK/SrfK